MVARADTLTRVDTNLNYAPAMVHDLPTIVEEWDDEPMINLHAWEMEWHEAMDRLHTVYEAREAGLLRPDQEERFQAVLRELKPQLPTVQRLELSERRVPID
ncbi:MAG: hypothetical protein H0V47_01435 [Chloroflexia bacterium]|nr:hypothetical protein [Chloroflexia bacterium]